MFRAIPVEKFSIRGNIIVFPNFAIVYTTIRIGTILWGREKHFDFLLGFPGFFFLFSAFFSVAGRRFSRATAPNGLHICIRTLVNPIVLPVPLGHPPPCAVQRCIHCRCWLPPSRSSIHILLGYLLWCINNCKSRIVFTQSISTSTREGFLPLIFRIILCFLPVMSL